MSQSRFSIVLVGVSALLRRPLVSRLRPAEGERSSWVVFAARGGRFDSGFRWAGWPSGSLLPLFGTHRFGVALGGLAFGLTASAFRPAPLRRLPLGEFVLPPSVSEIAARRVGLRTHCFRFSACAASEIAARRVGLRVHCFRFSACADPHRRTAEARIDGAQRHDNCFTSKHLSQHVNLPHRTP